MGIALTGLNSASMKLNASAANIANFMTSGSLEPGGQSPYIPRDAVAKAQGETGGVQTEIINRDPAFTPAYDPDSPFANDQGYIGVPNVDLATEIVTMKLAEISYKANLKTIQTSRDMFGELLRSFDKKI